MSYRPVVVRKELWFRCFCMGLTNPSREMKKWLRWSLHETSVVCRFGWDSSTLANEVKN